MKKKCNGCGEVKLYKFFYKDKSKKDGYGSQCKECKDQQINKVFNSEIGFLKGRYHNIIISHRNPQAIAKGGGHQHRCYFNFKEFCKAFEKHTKKHGMIGTQYRSAWGPHHLPMTMIHQGKNKPITGDGNRKSGRKKGQKSIESNLSCDRLDSSKPYTIQNLIFIRTDENKRKKDTSYEDCLAQIKLYEERFIKMESI